MTTIPLSELRQKWLADPNVRGAYDALEEEFALASAMIEARSRAGLTQEEVAQRMKTTQTAVARIESGRSHSSTRTLSTYAVATGTAMRIRFEPVTR